MARIKTALFAAAVFAVLIFAVIFILAQKQGSGSALGKDYAVVTFSPESLVIRAEIAGTDEERAQGLMFRTSLGKNDGMLFIYPSASAVNFWMKNTLIPLDIVFISEDFTVVKIHHAVPCQADPCPLYNSGQPIKYVLEVNGNLTTAYGIQEGESRVEIIR
ncbi:DUF192 domain-containing protein [Candidatus Woesearchaeota archaeon]|nr:DUF192 domain-containing protein [Candidatus Woesearchaeota archaeon]